MTDALQVATGASFGAIAHREHARQAVETARAKLGSTPIASVLLFLSGAYAHEPQEAIKEAVRAAGTPLVFGGCAVGLLTEQDWMLDAQGAVAMVFAHTLALQPINGMRQNNQAVKLALSISTPNASDLALGTLNCPQFGAVVTDEYGHGPYSVWQGGQIAEREYIHAGFASQLDHSIQIAEGVRALSPARRITRCDAHTIQAIDNMPAVDKLTSDLPVELRERVLDQPYTLLAGVYDDLDLEQIEQNNYQLHHVIAAKSKNHDGQQEIHLSGDVAEGQQLFWAIRDPVYAEQVMAEKLSLARAQLGGAAKFGILFPNISRGPEFFAGRDRDFEQFVEAFPNTPMIGCYTNAEIAPSGGTQSLAHKYSSNFAVFC